MRLLITGSNGFIGRNLTKHYEKYELSVFSTSKRKQKYTQSNYIQADLTNTQDVQQVLEQSKPNCIIHTAANPIIRFNAENPNQIIQDNILATQNLIHLAPENTHFLFCSSVVVYGNSLQRSGYATTENDLPLPNNLYGATKLSCESILQSYKSYKNITLTILRMCSTVGPNLTHGLLYDLIKRLPSKFDYHSDIKLLGSKPGSIKPFLHIDDLSSFLDIAITEKLDGIYNIVPDDIISVQNIANVFINQYRLQCEIYWSGPSSIWSGDNTFIQCSNKKAKIAGWQPFMQSLSAVKKAFNENRF